MRELMKNAQMGWLQYTSGGKLVALLLVALLLLWFGQKEIREKYKGLVWYTTIMTIVCICPVTAMVLMKYQTKFYDYQWIWNTVPVTIMIAFTVTVLWSSMMEKYEKTGRHMWKKIGITFLLVALICVSGGMKKPVAGIEPDVDSREATTMILKKISETGQNTDCILWAPKEIMEYARILDGRVRLLYGRNMWDTALNAYSYDGYGQEHVALYEWMTRIEETGTTDELTVRVCLDEAKDLGVTHMILPKGTEVEVLTVAEEMLETEGLLEGEYYLYCLR